MTTKPRKSFVSIFIENYDALVKRITWRLGSGGDVHDIVQDTYLKLQSLPEDSKVDNPRSYIFRMADNLAIDKMRSGQRELRIFEAGEEREYMDSSPSPEKSTDYKQRLRKLEQIIDDLPARQREAFILHKFDGLSHAQVAEQMSISTSAVEKLIMKALATCRDRMSNIVD
ncbi:MAG: RNA polymerase sigma factor [Pseudomonadota bacterium]